METTLALDPELAELVARLSAANREIARHHAGESGARQPVHTYYCGAQSFQHDTAQALGAQALRALAEHAPDASSFARALRLAGDDPAHRALYARIVEKLQREPVEDLRIDFEDGYGNRSDSEEDECARAVAHELARGMQASTLPAFIGIRIKTFSDERLRERAVRTLDILVTALVRETGGKLPRNFAVCLAKIKHPEHVAVLAEILALLERRLKLPELALKLEMMIESTLSILDERGNVQLPSLLAAARGRCVAAHFGTYDYTASCNIPAAQQAMAHPACGFALQLMQVAYAGTGIFLSDGSTNVLPTGAHVQSAWKLHFDDVQRSLSLGFFQGWDLHPAQLPTRYAALFDFFARGSDQAGLRLRNFVAKAGEATLAGDVLDDAATGQALLNFFLRALNSGALSEHEALERSGLTREELASRSFLELLKRRAGRA